MIRNPVSSMFGRVNNNIMEFENYLANKSVYIAKGLSPVISMLDVASEALKATALTAEHICLCIMNFLGSIFSLVFPNFLDQYTMYDAMKTVRYSLGNVGLLTTKILALPFDFCFQTYNIFKNPNNAHNAAVTVSNWLKPSR